MHAAQLFIGDHAKIRKTCSQLGYQRDRVGGFQQHRCYMKFEEQCGYKYLLNSASIGCRPARREFASPDAHARPKTIVASRLQTQISSSRCCSAAPSCCAPSGSRTRTLPTTTRESQSALSPRCRYVRDGMRHKEFYEYGLLPGVHYVATSSQSRTRNLLLPRGQPAGQEMMSSHLAAGGRHGGRRARDGALAAAERRVRARCGAGGSRAHVVARRGRADRLHGRAAHPVRA